METCLTDVNILSRSAFIGIDLLHLVGPDQYVDRDELSYSITSKSPLPSWQFQSLHWLNYQVP